MARQGVVVAAAWVVGFGSAAGEVLPVVNGQADSHTGVVEVLVRSVDDNGNCTGTYVGGGSVVTAAHCINERPDNSAVLVRFVDAEGAETIIATTNQITFQEYITLGPQADDENTDLAVLRVDACRVPAYVEPIPLLPPEIRLSAGDVGMQVTFVGFGRDEQGTKDDPDAGGAGTRRSGGLKIRAVNERHVALDSSSSFTCFGDSGGPLLVVRDGQEYVAGVSARLDTSDCTGGSVYTRVDTGVNQEFIGSAVTANAIGNADCGCEGCRGSPQGTLLIAAVALGLQRRRRRPQPR